MSGFDAVEPKAVEPISVFGKAGVFPVFGAELSAAGKIEALESKLVFLTTGVWRIRRYSAFVCFSSAGLRRSTSCSGGGGDVGLTRRKRSAFAAC
jgi:hypothetical protein